MRGQGPRRAQGVDQGRVRGVIADHHDERHAADAIAQHDAAELLFAAAAFGDVQVHAGRAVDFDHGTADFAPRTRDVGGDEVDADDIEADVDGHALGQRAHVGMHLRHDVARRAARGDIGVAAQCNALAGCQHAGERQALQREVLHHSRVGLHLLEVAPQHGVGAALRVEFGHQLSERP